MDVKTGPCLCGEPEKVGVDENGKPVITRCPLYQSLKVQKENGEWEDEWKCSIAWTPILLIENRNAMDACAKYTESLRNELVMRMDRARAALAPRAPELIEVQDAAQN